MHVRYENLRACFARKIAPRKLFALLCDDDVDGIQDKSNAIVMKAERERESERERRLVICLRSINAINIKTSKRGSKFSIGTITCL